MKYGVSIEGAGATDGAVLVHMSCRYLAFELRDKLDILFASELVETEQRPRVVAVQLRPSTFHWEPIP